MRGQSFSFSRKLSHASAPGGRRRGAVYMASNVNVGISRGRRCKRPLAGLPRSARRARAVLDAFLEPTQDRQHRPVVAQHVQRGLDPTLGLGEQAAQCRRGFVQHVLAKGIVAEVRPAIPGVISR